MQYRIGNWYFWQNELASPTITRKLITQYMHYDELLRVGIKLFNIIWKQTPMSTISTIIIMHIWLHIYLYDLWDAEEHMQLMPMLKLSITKWNTIFDRCNIDEVMPPFMRMGEPLRYWVVPSLLIFFYDNEPMSYPSCEKIFIMLWFVTKQLLASPLFWTTIQRSGQKHVLKH